MGRIIVFRPKITRIVKWSSSFINYCAAPILFIEDKLISHVLLGDDFRPHILSGPINYLMGQPKVKRLGPKLIKTNELSLLIELYR